MNCRSRQTSIFKGLFFAMVSGVFSSIVSVIVKQMKNLHPGQLALYRFLATVTMSMPAATQTGQNFFGPPDYRPYLVLRGLFGGFGYFSNFIAYRYLSLSEASVIVFSTPAVVTLFARLLFKEPCNISQSISVTLTIVGIIFTTKLPSHLHVASIAYSSERIYGLVAAVLSLFCMSGIHLVTRKMRSVPPSIITFNFGWVGVVVIAFLTAVLGDFKWHHCGIQSLYIILLALLGYTGQTLLVMAFQCEYAGPVSTVRAAADISLVFVWQIYIFDDVPDTYGIIGAVLVLVSIILISLDKWFTGVGDNLISCEKPKFT